MSSESHQSQHREELGHLSCSFLHEYVYICAYLMPTEKLSVFISKWLIMLLYKRTQKECCWHKPFRNGCKMKICRCFLQRKLHILQVSHVFQPQQVTSDEWMSYPSSQRPLKCSRTNVYLQSKASRTLPSLYWVLCCVPRNSHLSHTAVNNPWYCQRLLCLEFSKWWIVSAWQKHTGKK